MGSVTIRYSALDFLSSYLLKVADFNPPHLYLTPLGRLSRRSLALEKYWVPGIVLRCLRLILHLTVSVELRHGRRRGHSIYRARLLAYIASCDKNVAMLHGLLTNYQSGRGCFVSRRFRVTLSDKRLILWNDADLCWLVTTNYSFVRVICNVISSGNSVGSFWCTSSIMTV